MGARTNAVVKIGLSAEQLNWKNITVNDNTEIHLITVDGLSPDTAYYFQVEATDATGKTEISNVIFKRTKVQ